MGLFNRIRPDPGFVSPIRSDPVRSRFCQRPESHAFQTVTILTNKQAISVVASQYRLDGEPLALKRELFTKKC